MKPAPKSAKANCAYRRRILERAAGDPEFQRECWIRASRDPVWYCDTFAWTFRPKDRPDQPVVPFVLFEYQEKALHRILDAIGKRDMLLEKSREMGASWLILFALEFRWHFRQRQAFLIVSRKE